MQKVDGVLTQVSKEDVKLLETNPNEFWKGVKKIGGFAFTNSGVESLVIPEGVKSIGARAFHSCKHLKEVAVPQSVNRIEKAAFQWCWALKKVLLPDGLTYIDDFAFAGCEKIDKIVIPNYVEEIGKGAFAHCHQMEKINIPESVKTIGDKVFYGCGKLKEVYVWGSPKYGNATFEGMVPGARLYLREYQDSLASE